MALLGEFTHWLVLKSRAKLKGCLLHYKAVSCCRCNNLLLSHRSSSLRRAQVQGRFSRSVACAVYIPVIVQRLLYLAVCLEYRWVT